MTLSHVMVFFFFQAEDGIRDYKVTGVQTCALPISVAQIAYECGFSDLSTFHRAFKARFGETPEIGRASCRERAEMMGVGAVENIRTELQETGTAIGEIDIVEVTAAVAEEALAVMNE